MLYPDWSSLVQRHQEEHGQILSPDRISTRDSKGGGKGKTHSLMLEPGFLKNILKPVPLVSWIMVVAVACLMVAGQVQSSVQSHQL